MIAHRKNMKLTDLPLEIIEEVISYIPKQRERLRLTFRAIPYQPMKVKGPITQTFIDKYKSIRDVHLQADHSVIYIPPNIKTLVYDDAVQPVIYAGRAYVRNYQYKPSNRNVDVGNERYIMLVLNIILGGCMMAGAGLFGNIVFGSICISIGCFEHITFITYITGVSIALFGIGLIVATPTIIFAGIYLLSKFVSIPSPRHLCRMAYVRYRARRDYESIF